MSWLNDLIAYFTYKPTVERPSPKIRITSEQADALIKLIKTVPGYENCFIAAIASTNSLDPTIDDGMYVVLDFKVEVEDLIVGDIIWYETPTFKAIHRIIKIGSDPEWWCLCKGDNNSIKDPVIVRGQDIKGIWRATLN